MTRINLTVSGDLPAGTYTIEVSPPSTERHVIGFSQRDERWASVRLGPSRHTMGGSGCAVTAATMVATLANPEITPLSMVQYLNSHGGFTRPNADGEGGGLLYWSVAAQAVAGLTYVNYRKWQTYPADVDAVRTALSHNPQVIQVDFRPATSPLDTHFVTALSMTDDDTDINIIDPWTGERGTLLSMYSKPDWDLKRAVYALAEYRVE